MGFVILVGMMGSGKSTVGRALAGLLEGSFFDTDMLLEQRLGRQASQLFTLYGEHAFRIHETKVLQSLQPERGVLATGGGIVLKEENWVEIRRLGTSVFLDVDPEVLKHRLTVTKRRRPILEVPEWEEKFADIVLVRRPLYEKADRRVEIGDEPLADVAERIFVMVQGLQ